jgi:hypothetical protein
MILVLGTYLYLPWNWIGEKRRMEVPKGGMVEAKGHVMTTHQTQLFLSKDVMEITQRLFPFFYDVQQISRTRERLLYSATYRSCTAQL